MPENFNHLKLLLVFKKRNPPSGFIGALRGVMH
jgi:hypothetical protein